MQRGPKEQPLVLHVKGLGRLVPRLHGGIGVEMMHIATIRKMCLAHGEDHFVCRRPAGGGCDVFRLPLG